MPSTNEEILITMNGRDNASQMFSNVDRNAKSMASSVSQALSSINNGMISLGQVSDNVMQSLAGKSAMDSIFGTTSKAETNSVLVGMMTDTEEAAESLNKTVDNVTDNSLTSMQDLIPALNAFKAATGASDKEIENITGGMADFGAAVLAQTGSTDLAAGAMMDLSKGVKGAYASLDQYGISEDALLRTGKWDGAEDDVEGYMKAVQEVIGDTSKLMETNQGLDALIGKAFSRGGKRIGNEFLPQIKALKKGFLDLDESLDGNLTTSIVAFSGAMEIGNQAFWNISTTVNGVRDLKDAFNTLTGAIKGAGDAAEATGDAINTISNASDIGAGVAGAGGAIGAGADVAKKSSKSEKAVEGGMDALLMADMFKGNKKDIKKAEKEAEKVFAERGKLMEKIHNFSGDKNSKKFKNIQKQLVKNDLKLQKEINGFKPLEWLRKTKNKEEISPEQLTNLFGLQNRTVEGFEKSIEKQNMTLTKSIGGKLSNFKTSIGDIFTKFKSPFEKLSNFNFGESLQKGLKNSFGKIGDFASLFKEKITNIPSMLSSIPGKLKGSLGNLNKSLYQSISGFSLSGLKDKFKGLKGAKEITEGVKDVEKIGEGVSSMAAAGSTVAAAGPEMEAAAAGGAAVEAGATTLSGVFTSLMVPLLAVSAAIIIMIPIVSFIAAEAMIFIRLLADFMKALNFDNINLDGAVRGLKSLTTAFLWIGAAMLTLTAVNLTTALAAITSNFFGMTGPLKVAIDALTEAAQLLQQFGSVYVNPNIATNLQTISNSLLSVSSAMLALTATNITVGFSNFVSWALGFGSVTDGLEQAKNDIMAASAKLNEFSGLTPIPDNVATNIQNVCDSLASVGNAITALRDMRDGQNWDNLVGDLMSGLFGDGLNIQQAFDAVRQDIYDAATALSNWTDLPAVPEGLGEKIKNISDALTSVNDAFQTLRNLQGDNNFDDMMGGLTSFLGMSGQSIQEALNTVITDLNDAASALSNINIDDAAVNEDAVKKIQNVTNSLNEVTNVVNSLNQIPPMDGFDSSVVTTAVTNVQTAANALKGLTVGEINEDLITNIKNVAGAVTQISGVMTQLTSLPPMDGFDSSIITTAVTNVQTAATELSKLNETAFNAEGANSVLTSVQTAIENLKTTLSGASGFAEVSAGIGSQIVSGVATGLAPLSGSVQSNVSIAINSAGSNALSGGAMLGRATTTGFKSSLKLADVMTAEMGYVKSAVDSGIDAAVSAAQNGAEKVVEAFKNGINVGSPGDIARTMSGEMAYTLDAIKGSYYSLKNASNTAARTIVDGFGNPSLGVDMFTNEGNFTTEQIGALETTVTRAPDKSDNRPVTIIVSEGAVSVDARNKTTQEARQIMITALESLDNIKNIEVQGA